MTYITWFPPLFYSVALALAFYCYGRNKSVWKIVAVTVLAYLIFAGVRSYLQYQAWSATEFGRILLNVPLDANSPSIFNRIPFIAGANGGYFLYYVWSRFWMEIIFSIFVAFIFYGFLKLAQTYYPRLLKEHEPKIGLLAALFVGWPYFIFFLPVSLCLAIIFFIFNRIYFKENRIVLGLPLLIGAAIILLTGQYISKFIPIFLLRV